MPPCKRSAFGVGNAKMPASCAVSHRRPEHRPAPQRSRLREDLRRRPDPSQLRPHHPPPTRLRRRPPSQPRPPHDRRLPTAPRPRTRAYAAKRTADGSTDARSSAASSATSPARPTTPSAPTSKRSTALDIYRNRIADLARSSAERRAEAAPAVVFTPAEKSAEEQKVVYMSPVDRSPSGLSSFRCGTPCAGQPSCCHQPRDPPPRSLVSPKTSWRTCVTGLAGSLRRWTIVCHILHPGVEAQSDRASSRTGSAIRWIPHSIEAGRRPLHAGTRSGPGRLPA